MPKLIVANCTRQNHDFLYRVPEQQRIRMTTINVGAQAYIHQEDSIKVLDAIVEQHRGYGLIPVSEVDHTKAFFGLCYSYDKPIDIERIMQAVEHNDDVIDAASYEVRKTSALAIDARMENDDMIGNVSKLHVEVEQVGGGKTERIDVERVEGRTPRVRPMRRS